MVRQKCSGIRRSYLGLRLLPRGNTELFSRTAIAPGDIAIQLNNMSLTQQANLTQAQEALRHLQTAQITLLRNEIGRASCRERV